MILRPKDLKIFLIRIQPSCEAKKFLSRLSMRFAYRYSLDYVLANGLDCNGPILIWQTELCELRGV